MVVPREQTQAIMDRRVQAAMTVDPAAEFTIADRFEEIVARHPQIELIVCGHLHRNIQTSVGSRRVLTCPSSAHQVALDLRDGAPSRFFMD